MDATSAGRIPNRILETHLSTTLQLLSNNSSKADIVLLQQITNNDEQPQPGGL